MSYLDRFGLEGKVALVPGGGGAIGSAIAGALAAAGAKVTVVDVTAERAEAAAEKLRAEGADILALGADVTQEADCERIVAATVERFGRLDIIVNAVGGGAGKVLFDAQEYPRDAWDWIMELNVRSTLVATQAAVREMIRDGQRRRRRQHQLRPGGSRHQRRLLRVRRREGRDQLPHPPVGDRVGQARHPRQRDPPHLRRHPAGGDAPRRPRLQGRRS